MNIEQKKSCTHVYTRLSAKKSGDIHAQKKITWQYIKHSWCFKKCIVSWEGVFEKQKKYTRFVWRKSVGDDVGLCTQSIFSVFKSLIETLTTHPPHTSHPNFFIHFFHFEYNTSFLFNTSAFFSRTHSHTLMWLTHHRRRKFTHDESRMNKKKMRGKKHTEKNRVSEKKMFSYNQTCPTTLRCSYIAHSIHTTNPKKKMVKRIFALLSHHQHLCWCSLTTFL